MPKEQLEALPGRKFDVDTQGSTQSSMEKTNTDLLEDFQAELLEIFSENVTAKMWRLGVRYLGETNVPTSFPEYVPQEGAEAGKYVLREPEFWTCGFFPGILYCLLERAIKYPQTFPYIFNDKQASSMTGNAPRRELLSLCRAWSDPLHKMTQRTDTHDLGFMIEPALRADWELTGNELSLASLLTAAKSLASRYNPQVGAIRSWDKLVQKDISITDMTEDFIVIIDSMCNLDLLFYASEHLCDPALAEIAIAHAKTLLRTHLRTEVASENTDSSGLCRPMFSTYHVVNLDPRTGFIKEHRTAQGYNTMSTWARGQAWAILGYAQTYAWTKDVDFLNAACGLTEYFMWRLKTAPASVNVPIPKDHRFFGKRLSMGHHVPLWDFDAPIEDEQHPLRDSSAGVIAANGMLVLSQALFGAGKRLLAGRYQEAALAIVSDTVVHSLSTETATFTPGGYRGEHTVDGCIRVQDATAMGSFDALLKNATVNHNRQDYWRYSNHGLIYGDYYLIEFGNKLLRMGLV